MKYVLSFNHIKTKLLSLNINTECEGFQDAEEKNILNNLESDKEDQKENEFKDFLNNCISVDFDTLCEENSMLKEAN